jgi:hypothetical protein
MDEFITVLLHLAGNINNRRNKSVGLQNTIHELRQMLEDADSSMLKCLTIICNSLLAEAKPHSWGLFLFSVSLSRNAGSWSKTISLLMGLSCAIGQKDGSVGTCGSQQTVICHEHYNFMLIGTKVASLEQGQRAGEDAVVT